MTYQIDCPACRQKLYFPSIDSYEHLLEGICTKCRYKYTLEQGEVVLFNSALKVLQSSTYGNKIIVKYKRTYQIRLLSANKTVKSLEFSTPGQQEHLAALPGDKLLLLYTMRETKQEDVAWAMRNNKLFFPLTRFRSSSSSFSTLRSALAPMPCTI